MFQPSQHDVRTFFCGTARKQRDGVVLLPMEAQAARWQQVSAALADLSDRETEVRERARAAEQTARQRAEQVRAEATAPVRARK